MSPRNITSAALIGAASAVTVAGGAGAAELVIEISIPEIETSSYYRPYLAAWIEEPETRAHRSTLAVWYDTRLRDNLGAAFLRDLRTWWRSAGEQMTTPADGITGPTRAPGTHRIVLGGGEGQLADLPPGDYVLAIEASREKGGREVLRTPFSWGGAANAAGSDGSKELGAVRVEVRP